jgi:hypothetical protein
MRDASATPSGIKREWYVCMYDLCMFIRYLVFMTQVLKDT